MKPRRGHLLASLLVALVALVVGGALVARSPRARVRWLEVRARSSDRKVREEARWALLASRPAIDDDECVELVAAEADDLRVKDPRAFLCTARYTGGVWSNGVVTSFYRPTVVCGRCPEKLAASNDDLSTEASGRRRPLLVLGDLIGFPPYVRDYSIQRSVPLDAALAEKIEKLARH